MSLNQVFKVCNHYSAIEAGKTMKKIIETKKAPKPVGPYSQAVEAGGFIFLSGQLAIDPKDGKIIAQDIKGQTMQVIANMKAILEEAGYALDDIIQTNVYLSSMDLFRLFNEEYSKHFKMDSPARVTVAVQLPLNGLVEISAVAYKKRQLEM